MNQFERLEVGGKLALFVNSENPPDEEIPLDFYSYQHVDFKQNKYRFFRLCRVSWVLDNAIKYSILDWREVTVKDHCVQAMKQLIDSMKGAKEFLS